MQQQVADQQHLQSVFPVQEIGTIHMGCRHGEHRPGVGTRELEFWGP